MVDEHREDVETAAACLANDSSALEQLARLLQSVVPALKARGASDEDVDEILQLTRTSLLVAEKDREPKLVQYSGQGRLGGFIRTVAMRIWLNSKRGQREFNVAPQELHVLAGSTDPALENLKQNYLRQFRKALGLAWQLLETDHRDFLHHQLVDRLSIDVLATLYGVHRSTAARRLVAAKEALVSTTRTQLQAVLGNIPEHEISSILRLIDTRLEQAAEVLVE